MSATEFVSDWILCIVLSGCWYDNVILGVYASTENESDDSKDGFCEELEQVFIHFSSSWDTEVGCNLMVHKSFWFMLMLVLGASTTNNTEAIVVTN
jgi:hypothetical protein